MVLRSIIIGSVRDSITSLKAHRVEDEKLHLKINLWVSQPFLRPNCRQFELNDQLRRSAQTDL